MRNFLRLFILLVAVSLVGCGASLPTIKPYKMDIQQGNVVTSEMLLKLRPGMTKSQVKFIMGTPLLVDSFRTNRWDYFYQLRKQGKIVSQRRVILDFENDLLKEVRGDVVPKGKTAEDLANDLADEAKEPSLQEEAVEVIEPVVVPVEDPDVTEMKADVEPMESGLLPTDEPAKGAESASILAVPIPIAPSELAPEVDVPTALNEAPEEMVENNVVEEMPSAVDVVENDAGKTVAVEAPKKVLPTTLNADDRLVFRLDRQLDLSRIKPVESAVPDASSQESVVQDVKKSQDEVLLDQEDPGFFERVLEKIGF